VIGSAVIGSAVIGSAVIGSAVTGAAVWVACVVPLEPSKRPLLAALMTGFLPFKKKNKS
jgi:hypothetical protein